MRRLAPLMLLLLLAACRDDPDLQTLNHDGLAREYLLRVPAAYDGTTPVPLVVALHGGGGSGPAQETESQMTAKAEEAGFIIVYPSAWTDEEGAHRWNVGPRTSGGRQSTADDVGFLDALVTDLESRFNIDPKRIYATGMSNGGMMAYRLACERSDRYAAIGVVSTSMLADPCAPTRPVPLLHLHGSADKLIPYAGGPSSTDVPEDIRLTEDFRPTRDLLALWAENDGCAAAPQTTSQQGEVTCESWAPCSGGADVALCTIDGGGHAWPGSTAYPLGKTFFGKLVTQSFADIWPGHVTRDIIADDALWAFFTAHPLP